VVAGTLHERSLIATPRGRGAARERLLGPGATRAFGQGYVHQVTNTGTEPAVSVHVYAPRLTAMTIFENDAGVLDRPGTGPLTRLRVERSGEDW
ncbi:MAG: cysteine dioxygenase, partial [Streptomycetaceae bacterium]|nr:cysteine dioxygenase [Streptomycetaceae bacterium]